MEWRRLLELGSTFREDLNFYFYPQSNLKCRDFSCLIKSMARAKYFGIRCKTVVFYYAGHGGINENGESFIKLPDGEFYIDRDIVCHFSGDHVNKKKRFLFFFDSCLSGNPQPDIRIQIPYVPVGSLLAHATSIGDKSFGNTSSGGIWTRLLCENLKKQLSVSDILDDTHTAVMVELKDAQKPMYISRTGTVFLKGRRELPDEDLLQLTDPVKLWKHHGKEFKKILQTKNSQTLLSLTGGLHSKDIIDDKTNSQVLEHYHTAEGPEMIYSEILKKLEEENDRDINAVLMSTVLDIMDVQDQLCGLVRRMRIILDSQKLGSNILREHREEILDCLQGNKTAIISLSGALRTAGLIDSLTNNSSADFACGPQKIMKCLEKVVDSKPQLLLKILSLMEKHECLRNVVEVMNKKCTSDLHEDASLDSKILKLEMEKEELQKKRNEKVFMLENEMQQVNLDSERQLRVKDKKLMALKDIIKNTPSHHDHNSHITSGRDDIDGGKVRHFEKRVKELEKHQKLLMEKETEGRKRLEELQKRFHEMERKHKKELMEKNLQIKKFREEFFVGNF